MLHGEYGISDVVLSIPTVVGKNGLETKVPIALNNEEMVNLHKSAKALKKVIVENDI